MASGGGGGGGGGGTGGGEAGGGGGGGGGWVVADLGSSNGTALRLSMEREASRAFELQPGRLISFGNGPRSPEFTLARCVCVASARRGRRHTMEDAHVLCHRLLPPGPLPAAHWPTISVFAVYDGHGGGEASDFCQRRLHALLASRLSVLLGGAAAAGESACGGGEGAEGGEAGGNGAAEATTTVHRRPATRMKGWLRRAFDT